MSKIAQSPSLYSLYNILFHTHFFSDIYISNPVHSGNLVPSGDSIDSP